MDDQSYFMENLAEEEMGQLHSIHITMNAIEAIRKQVSSGPSLSHCKDCGEEIPTARQAAIPGVTRCIDCQEIHERRSR